MFGRSNHYARAVGRKVEPGAAGAPSVTDRQEILAGFNQSALASASGILIGAGGIGSLFGLGLVRKGIGRLQIVDHDVVEVSNLNRQFFYWRDLHKLKAPRLARNLAEHAYSGTVLEGHGHSFQDMVALEHAMAASFVVCGVDNSTARVEVCRHFQARRTPVVFVAVDLVAEGGYCFIQEPGKACFLCAFPKALTPRKIPCRTPAVMDVLMAVVGLGLYAIDSLLMDRKRNWNLRHVHLAGFAPDVLETIERRPDCPVCGVPPAAVQRRELTSPTAVPDAETNPAPTGESTHPATKLPAVSPPQHPTGHE